MKGRIEAVLVFCLVMTAFFGAIAIVPLKVGAATLYVGGTGPGNYTTIQAAIDAANPGDTVHVFSGTYNEQVTIAKTMSLVGESNATTIVDGQGTGYIVRVNADWVNVTGFTLTNGAPNFYDAGVVVDNAKNCRIDGNIMSNAWAGIHLYFSGYITLANNRMYGVGVAVYGDSVDHWRTHNIDITNTVNGKPLYYWKDRVLGTVPLGAGEVILANSTGVVVEGQDFGNGTVGVEVGFSSNNTIANDTFSSNSMAGIYEQYSSDDRFINNTVTKNQDGIILADSSNSTAAGNRVSDNGHDGIMIPRSNHMTVVDNTVTLHKGGIGVSGISCGYCSWNTIAGNNISFTNGSAIDLMDATNNTVIGNTATQNWKGIYVFLSKDNALINNTLFDTEVGIEVEAGTNTTAARNIVTGNTGAGIRYSGSSRGLVVNNTLSGNYGGISIEESKDVTVDGNSVSDSGYYSGGVHGRNSDGVTITNNLIENNVHGVHIEYSTRFTLKKNTMLNDSILITGYLLEHWNSHMIETSNTVGGKPVQYLSNVTGGSVPPGAGEVILANATGMIVSDQNLGVGTAGVLLGFSSYNIVRNNTASDGKVNIALSYSERNEIVNNTVSDAMTGIDLSDSGNNTIRGNTIANNDEGIGFFFANTNLVANNTINASRWGINFLQSERNLVINNTLFSGTSIGIWLGWTTGNSVYHNNFFGKGELANDSGLNSWDNGYPSGGNYWSDYTGTDVYKGPNQNIPGSDEIGDTPYAVPAGTNEDRYPLMKPIGVGPLPPSAPQGLRAKAGNANITLTWDAPIDDGGSPIANYTLYRGMDPGSEMLLQETGNMLTYTDTGLMNGQVYYYQVTAKNVMGESLRSNEAYATPATIPEPPTGLTVVTGNGQVTLRWTAPAESGGFPIINYTIYRGVTTGDRTLLAEIGNVLAYADTGLTNGVTYYYAVAAVNAVGHGPNSTEVNATPATTPSEPRDLHVSYVWNTDTSSGRIVLAWSSPASDGGSQVTSYRIYRGTEPGNETLLVDVGNVLNYNDTTAVPLQKYYYRVSAVNAIGEGQNSTEVTAELHPRSPPPSPKSILEEPWFWAIAAMAIIILVAVAFLIMRRRRRETQEKDKPQEDSQEIVEK